MEVFLDLCSAHVALNVHNTVFCDEWLIKNSQSPELRLESHSTYCRLHLNRSFEWQWNWVTQSLNFLFMSGNQRGVGNFFFLSWPFSYLCYKITKILWDSCSVLLVSRMHVLLVGEVMYPHAKHNFAKSFGLTEVAQTWEDTWNKWQHAFFGAFQIWEIPS